MFRIWLGLSLGVVAAGAQPLPVDEIVEAAARRVEENYVFPEVGTQIAAHLRARGRAGAYATVQDPTELARRLTSDLQALNGDKHLRVRAGTGGSRAGGAGTGSDNATYGVHRAEILPANVGYVAFTSFGPLERVREAVTKAMDAVATTRALIIDLRGHRGGSPETVAYVTSYLYGSEPVHLNSLYYRGVGTTDFWTHAQVPGRRFGAEKPVYLLTGKRTFSAGEEFAYNLRARGRATLIGATTGGGAHPGAIHRLPGGFSIFVSNGRAINPVTGTNWEGTGVEPHVPAPENEAFAIAYRRALEGVFDQLDAATRQAVETLLAAPPQP